MKSNNQLFLLSAIFMGCMSINLHVLADDTEGVLEIHMQNIPSGDFIMGSCTDYEPRVIENRKRAFMGEATKGDACQPSVEAEEDEGLLRRVSIKAFQMSTTEITLGTYKKFIAATNYRTLLTDYFIKSNSFGDDAPVVEVSWRDANAFIGWLNQVAGTGWRLPTESEWEYACLSGKDTKFCGGNIIDHVAWNLNNSKGHQQNVATKSANNFGLYDMSGNVWEWVQDCYHAKYNTDNGTAPVDGSAWIAEDDDAEDCERVLRGGSWGGPNASHRSKNRHAASQELSTRYYGFRVARDLPEK